MLRVFFVLCCLSFLWFGNIEIIHAADIDTSYAVYIIRNAANKRCMQIGGNIYYNEKYNDDSKINLNKPEHNEDGIVEWQQWYVIYNKTIKGTKYYYLRNVFSGKLLNASRNALGGLQIQKFSKANLSSGEALWSIKKKGSCEGFRIVNLKTGYALGAQLDATAITLQSINNSDKQLWLFIQQPAVSYRDDEVVQFFNRNNKSLGSVAFDEGMSIPLHYGANKGKVLWVTQDAWDGEALQSNNRFSCKDVFQYRNSIIIQPSISDWNPYHTLNLTRDGSMQQRPKQICDVMPNTEFAWPAAGVEIGNHVFIQCGEGDGLMVKGQSLYDLTENTNNHWDVKRTVPVGLGVYAHINYAAGMVKSADGYVYVFGTKGKDVGYACNVYVARFDAENPQIWKFWNGTSWADSIVSGDSARVVDGLGTAAVSFVNGKYVIVTMDQGFNCDTLRNIYAAVSDNPTGPFTKRKKVYSITEYFQGSYARYYTPAIHPEFDNGRKEMLVTYSLNFSGCGLNECVNNYQDPYFYRIKGLRIPYKLIGL